MSISMEIEGKVYPFHPRGPIGIDRGSNLLLLYSYSVPCAATPKRPRLGESNTSLTNIT